MKVTIKQFLNTVKYVARNKTPILIRGPHGIGKSELVSQIANELGLEVVMRRGSQMTSGDLLGLPSITNEETNFNPPGFIKKACTKGVCLFLDEIDRAEKEIEQGLFELCDSRGIAGNKLHDDTVIFAACNGGSHKQGDQYSVATLDPAALDRWTIFDLTPTVSDWLSWAQNHCHEFIFHFISDNPAFLEHAEDKSFEPHKIYPSRRSWKRLSDCLGKGPEPLFDKLLSSDKIDEIMETIMLLSGAYVGLEAAIAFSEFLREGIQVKINDILDGKITQNKIKKMNMNQQNSLIDKFEFSKTFEKELTEKEIKNLAIFFISLPPEIGMRFYKSFGASAGIESLTIFNSCKVGECKIGEVIISDYAVKAITGEF